MAQGPQRQDEPRTDPPVARTHRRPEAAGRRVRLSVPVPPLVDAVLARSGKDAGAEISRVLAALFKKLTPQRGPADKGPYAGEVYYFERLLDAPTETLTLAERLFVTLNRLHEELLELAHEEEGSETARREVEQAIEAIAELVDSAQAAVRDDRGEDTAQLEWEITEP